MFCSRLSMKALRSAHGVGEQSELEVASQTEGKCGTGKAEPCGVRMQRLVGPRGRPPPTHCGSFWSPPPPPPVRACLLAR